MAPIRLDLSSSLDGFVAGPKDNADDPMGVGGFRLFNRLDHREEPGPHGDAYAEAMAHGTGAAQSLLRAGKLDELELPLVPGLLGQGKRPFDHPPADTVELELVRQVSAR